MTMRIWTGPRAAALVLGAAVLAGCGLLDTQTPNIIDPGTLESPEAAASLRFGAIADFAFAKDGDGTETEDGLILVAGLLSDEFEHSTTPPTEQEVDQRSTAVINPHVFSAYANLHKARAGAERAADALRRLSVEPDSSTDIAEMFALSGFAYVYFAEDFCSGVPFSKVVGDSLVYGAALTTTQMYDTALARFDSALAEPGMAVDDGTITNLATMGRARALLDLGLFAEAAAAASTVPTDFTYGTEHRESPLRLQNAIFDYTNDGLWSLSDFEGGVGLGYRTAADPRVPFTDFQDTGLDLITPQFSLDKYGAADPIPVADGIEARLIEAEAQLQTGNRSGMRTTLNDLRQSFPDLGLSNLSTPSTQAAAIDLLFSERAFWLFATGHRLGDMRRLIRQYGRGSETVFPTGGYHKGGSYGTDVNFPIPLEEENNPNSAGCLDRNP